MARSDAFFAEFGCRPDVSTIFVRFFDENSIDFVERLLDDRRSLDDTFIVPARTLDVRKTLKNLDRAHKIRVRRCFANPLSRRHGLHTTSKIHRKVEGKLEQKQIEKLDENRGSRPSKIDVLGVLGPVQRPKIEPSGLVRVVKREKVARSSSIFC